ncbi:MAG: Lrp/AsnC family transcriptional regulator [Oscillospiraceae bacterium]|nr:Lrp/AsnC family transcriptional regulator [Oscillospiraceae bacterium]
MDKLLLLLQQNARLTTAQLAATLGVDEKEINVRMAALEAEGLVRGYTALIDWEKAGTDHVTAHIELKVTPRRDSGFDAIAETIAAMDEVESVSLMSGGYDLSVAVVGKTFQEVAMFVARRLSPLEGVVATSTHFVLKRYKEKGVVFAGEPRDERGVIA